jgi:hypothetical protein
MPSARSIDANSRSTPKIVQVGLSRTGAIVSAPKDDANHPRKMVLNAFLRRGAPVRSTQGNLYRYYRGMGQRVEMKPAEVFDFFDKVEAYD